jgi:hypothetical protein
MYTTINTIHEIIRAMDYLHDLLIKVQAKKEAELSVLVEVRIKKSVDDLAYTLSRYIDKLEYERTK